MRDAADLGKIAAIVRLREAQGEAARSTLFAENEAVHRNEEIERQQRDARDTSLRVWTEQLASSTFDPLLERLGGAWLLKQERQLEASYLDTAIVRERRVKALEALSVASARTDASREIRTRLGKALAKDREERQSGEIADLFLHRRHG